VANHDAYHEPHHTVCHLSIQYVSPDPYYSTYACCSTGEDGGDVVELLNASYLVCLVHVTRQIDVTARCTCIKGWRLFNIYTTTDCVDVLHLVRSTIDTLLGLATKKRR
jgi:hypothetical protein